MASNLQLRIAHLEPQTLALWVLSPHSNREFCVHGIVVHLRLGNCIGYSLRESIPIGTSPSVQAYNFEAADTSVLPPLAQSTSPSSSVRPTAFVTDNVFNLQASWPSSAVTLATFGRWTRSC